MSEQPTAPAEVNIPAVIHLLEIALKTDDADVREGCIRAALDFARNDEEALAEGRRWADDVEADGLGRLHVRGAGDE